MKKSIDHKECLNFEKCGLFSSRKFINDCFLPPTDFGGVSGRFRIFRNSRRRKVYTEKEKANQGFKTETLAVRFHSRLLEKSYMKTHSFFGQF